MPNKDIAKASSTRPKPGWLVDEVVNDEDLGVLLSGKEAQINLVKRTGTNGTSCLLARKHYLPRKVTDKGTLEALGLQGASTFRNDVEYREGRQFRKSRDRRAVAQMSAHGKRLMQARWTGHESKVLETLWEAGLNVPYPVAFGDDYLLMQYLGEREGAAPQLAAGRLRGAAACEALRQVREGLAVMVRAGWVHGDLSAFNLLWWHDEIWFIDFPQALDLASNPQGLNYLHRDVSNIAAWFVKQGVDVDPEVIFGELMGELGAI